MSNMDSIEIIGHFGRRGSMEALVQLGAREDEVDVEVLATPRAGVLGLGAREARGASDAQERAGRRECTEVTGGGTSCAIRRRASKARRVAVAAGASVSGAGRDDSRCAEPESGCVQRRR